MKADVFETGTIKWYSITRQFGFVIRADKTEVFFHHAHIRYFDNGNCDHKAGICARAVGLLPEASGGTLQTAMRAVERGLEKQIVTFTIAEGFRGLEARRVGRAQLGW